MQFHLNGFEPGDPEIFDRSERYHLRSIPQPGSDASNLRTLVSAWLKGDADRVVELYRARLNKRLELARDAFLA